MLKGMCTDQLCCIACAEVAHKSAMHVSALKIEVMVASPVMK